MRDKQFEYNEYINLTCASVVISSLMNIKKVGVIIR